MNPSRMMDSQYRGGRWQFLHSAIAVVYFFFNSLWLPFGLLYTHLLSPFFYVYLAVKKRGVVLFPLLVFLVPYGIVHLLLGVDLKTFLLSNALVISTYIVVATFAYILPRTNLKLIFKQLLILNFVFTLICIPLLFTPWLEVVWYMEKFTNTVSGLPRLAMLTYEASYYSTLFAPIAVYYLLKLLMGQYRGNKALLLVLVLVPMGLSLSLGVIGAIVLAFGLMMLVYWKNVVTRLNFFWFTASSLLVGLLATLVLVLFFRDSALYIRLENILTGIDSSMLSRTVHSLELALLVVQEKSIWFGSGLGQIKVLVKEIALYHYGFKGEVGIVRIPNAVIETFAVFGITGLLVRFFLITYFFFRAKVTDNYFQFLLFAFIFIYQFTGSFIVNIAEYVIWLLAFNRVFPAFDVKPNAIENGSP